MLGALGQYCVGRVGRALSIPSLRVEPGRYLLTLSAGIPATGWACALGMPAARTQMWVELRDGENLDLGEIVMDRVPRPEVGDVAPPISAQTLDGKPFELTDNAGKVIWTFDLN